MLDAFRAEFGEVAFAQFTKERISALRKKYHDEDAPYQWRSLRMRMIVVESFYADEHPGAGIGSQWKLSKSLNVPTSDQNRPWPMPVLREVVREATPEFRAVITVALLTAQRIGDVCALKTSAYDPAEKTLSFRQEKTRKLVVLHVPPHLAAAFERMSGRGDRLLSTPRGRPWNSTNARETLQAICHRLDLERYVLHGLRATGPVALKMLGFENRAIRAITGHDSDDQLEAYLRGVATLPLAKKGQTALNKAFASVFVAGEAKGTNARKFSGTTGRAAANAGVKGSSRKNSQLAGGNAK